MTWVILILKIFYYLQLTSFQFDWFQFGALTLVKWLDFCTCSFWQVLQLSLVFWLSRNGFESLRWWQGFPKYRSNWWNTICFKARYPMTLHLNAECTNPKLHLSRYVDFPWSIIPNAICIVNPLKRGLSRIHLWGVGGSWLFRIRVWRIWEIATVGISTYGEHAFGKIHGPRSTSKYVPYLFLQ